MNDPIKKLNKYDLEERTAKLGENIILFCKNLKQDSINKPLILQIIRSATSIGANYMEANNASSRKDFTNKIFISKKESQETKHWLRMLSVSNPEKKNDLNTLWQEAHELTMVFQKIVNTLRKNVKIDN